MTVLEHMERLDAVEASLERLGIENVPEEEIEEDVGESSSTAPRPIAGSLALAESALIASSSAPSRGGAPELTPVPEGDSPPPSVLTEEHEEEDVVALSKSLSHLDTRPLSVSGQHGRGASHSAQATRQVLDWMQDEPAKKRTVISEVGQNTRFVIDFDLTHASLTPAARDGYQEAAASVLVIRAEVLLAFEPCPATRSFFWFGPR